MPTTDTSERGLENLIIAALTSTTNGAGYVAGEAKDYDRDCALDWAKLLAFLQATQPDTVERLGLLDEGIRRQQFLARVAG